MWLDAVNERFASVNINTSVAISQGLWVGHEKTQQAVGKFANGRTVAVQPSGLCYFTQPINALNANHGMHTQLQNQLPRFGPLTMSIWLCLACLMFGTLSEPARAVTVNGLYEATVRVKDRSEAARNAAFASALAVVLVKVSGRSDAPARIGAAANSAGRYVQRFSYLTNGQLEVGFESTAINNMLEQAGLPLWDRERPNTLVVYPQALQGVREANMATEQAAKVRGVPIVWASAETSEQLPTSNLQQLRELARRYDASAILIARPGPGEASIANLRWQLVFNDASQEMSGAAEAGPNLAAEVLGRYYATTSKESLRLVMEVSGVDNLDAYARTVSYLSGLVMVRAVSVEALRADVLRVSLEVRGNQESLRRTLAVDQKLVEVAPGSTTATQAGDSSVPLAYRYRP